MLGGMRDISGLREDLKQRVDELTSQLDSLAKIIANDTKMREQQIRQQGEFVEAVRQLTEELKKSH